MSKHCDTEVMVDGCALGAVVPRAPTLHDIILRIFVLACHDNGDLSVLASAPGLFVQV